MSEHKVTLTWKRGDKPFEYQKYSRDHTWKFDGGHEMQASAAPAYLGNPKLVDPEEAFVASLSSLSHAHVSGHRLQKEVRARRIRRRSGRHHGEKRGRQTGHHARDTSAALKFSGEKQPTPQELEEMNHGAHEQCFIANSVKTEVKVEPQT